MNARSILATARAAQLAKAKKGAQRPGHKYTNRTQNEDGSWNYEYAKTGPGARTTGQAQAAIDRMLRAGFKRSEFKVSTERKYHTDRETGRRFYEWGDAKISIHGTYARAIELTEAMLAEGLSVTQTLMDGRPRSVEIESNGRGELHHFDVDAPAGQRIKRIR